MKTVFFPGSFNPFTKGHADIALRLLGLADRVILGIGTNSGKETSRTAAEATRKDIEKWIEREDLAGRVSVELYTGLTAETALSLGADCLARGVRNATDFDYEYSMAAANRAAFGIDTILMPADPALSFVNSTMIRDLESFGKKDAAERFLP